MRYVRVTTVDELLERLGESGAVILSGGTDLLVKMRAAHMTPETLLDISKLEELRGVRATDDALKIGAATSEEDLLRSDVVADRLPLLRDVLRVLGSVQIRNRGTLGGNLANASPAADSAVPLLLYDAELELQSAGGVRRTPVESFFTGPGRTALEPGEFVRSVRVPLLGDGWSHFFHKVGKRRALTIAIASVGALLRVQGERIIEARLAAGSVAPVPLRLRSAEGVLRDVPLDESSIARARQAACDAVRPISDVRATADYRRRVVGELVARALRSVRP